MKQFTSIALVECWFGPFPAWHDLYLRTCAANPTVQWVIFHDAPAPKRRSENVRFVHLTKEDFVCRISRVLNRPFVLTSGHKACDFKPAFGAIFADFLADFSFWGYNDSDLFWGDIRHFITEELLANHDIITGCRTSIVGQFTLFRNAGVTREVHTLIDDYENKIITSKTEHLDEGELDHAVSVKGLRICRRQLQVHDENAPEWEQMARQLEMEERGNLDEWFWEGGPCLWKEGHLTHIATGKETMFFHFRTWKYHWRENGLLHRLVYRDAFLDGFTITRQGMRLRFKPQWFLLEACSRGLHGIRRGVFYCGRAMERVKRIPRGIMRRFSVVR